VEDLSIDISNETALPAVSKKLLAFAKHIKVFAIEAPIGAGKTTLIKQLCKTLGSQDHFGSPTYSIVNEYSYPGGKIFHFDLYRLKSVNELFDIGFEEYMDGKQFCFIEWPGIVLDLVPKPYIIVKIDILENKRVLKAQANS
jgi:tRNA threonylcarbamoyladenosine biosynthesis protein TsaE